MTLISKIGMIFSRLARSTALTENSDHSLQDSNTPFPYEEIHKDSGDYFDSVAQAQAAGLCLEQIWSVIIDGDICTYGPPHHFVNVIGYVGTKELHDHNTYFEERL